MGWLTSFEEKAGGVVRNDGTLAVIPRFPHDDKSVVNP